MTNPIEAVNRKKSFKEALDMSLNGGNGKMTAKKLPFDRQNVISHACGKKIEYKYP